MCVFFVFAKLFCILVAQNRISAFWFDGKELAFAFGLTLAFSRLVSHFIYPCFVLMVTFY